MEMRKKRKTLAGLFLKFAVLFCVNTVLIIIGSMLLLIASAYVGISLPANYAEIQLTEHNLEIQKAGDSPEKWIPQGCTYGVYDAEGGWRAGSFTEQERKDAWEHYEEDRIYSSAKGYYRFIRQENGNLCIVKYDLYMKYSWQVLNELLPPPEIMSFVVDAILFVLNAVFLSRHFAKNLNRQLDKLRGITEKIAENNLEFQVSSSEIREIDEVMNSLSRLREALKESLTAQWDMEQQKQEQLSALTHDIKTPLTIIRGNAELLAESGLSREDEECAEYILSNANDIERYLEHIRQVLYGNHLKNAGEEKRISCVQLGEIFKDSARQLAAAEKIPISFDIVALENCVYCNLGQILRAWNNILSNGAEHTEPESGMEITLRMDRWNKEGYLVAAVRDYGPGFSPRDLTYADQEFYSGDTSRCDRKHQGLGLAIAKKFLQEQGGRLVFENHKNQGAVVSCWIKTCG